MIELARQQSRRALVDYETAIKEEIIPREETLRKEEKRFDVARRLFWQNYESRNSIRRLDLSKKLAIVEAQKRIANILKAGKDRSIRVVDSSKRTEVLTTNETLYHYISKG